MNKARRQWIEKIVNELETQRDELNNVYEEEQEAYDNLPESIQGSERGEEMYEGIGTIEDASDSLDELIENLRELIEK